MTLMHPWSRQLRRQARLLLAGSGLRPVRLALRHRGVQPRDVFLASYPRSGNTWVRFLLADVLTGEDPGFEETALLLPYVGRHRSAPELLPGGGRLIKTHERFQDCYRRAIYLVRDPRAVAVSEHRFQTMHGFVSFGLDRFLQEFVAGRVHGLGAWGEHVGSWLDSGLGDRLLVLRYETLREDPEDSLGRILRHLGVEADRRSVFRALERNTIQRMRTKEDASDLRKSREHLRHVDRGQTTSWREQLTERQSDLIVERWRPLLERLGYSTA